ncbi:MAG: hypothetical protein ACRDG7_17790 [Candidatus Limnocylindria bacterium]
MRPNARHLFWLIALAVLAALLVLFLFRPPVVAPTAVRQSVPAEVIRNAIPAADPVPWAAVDWQPQEEPLAADQPPLIRMDGIVDGGDLILGWGRAATPGRNQFNDMGAVFVSRDGRSWQTALIDHGVEAANGSELNGVAVGPRGYLAYGGVCCDPERRAVWQSADATRWTRLDLRGGLDAAGVSFASVVGIESGWIAVGNTMDAQQGQIWFSRDGADWELIDPDAAGIDGATLSDLAVGPDGLIVVGTVDGPDGTYDGGVWTSPDGVSWQRVGADDPALAGEDEVQLHGVVVHAGGIFVTGISGSSEDRRRCDQLGMVASADSRPRATALSCAVGIEHHWVSRTGETWERIAPMEAPGEHPIEFRVVVAGGPGLIVLGESSPAASPDTTLFSSPDGRRWSPVGPRQPIGNGVAIGLAVRDRQVLAVADHFDGNRSEIRIWLGSVN